MSERKLPIVVDLMRLVEQRAELTGNLALKDMERLAPLLVNTKGNVKLELVGQRDIEGLPTLTGQLVASVQVVCQRCLQPLDLVIDDNLLLSPIAAPEEAENLPESYEPVLITGPEQSLSELIEDELILRVPMVAMHEPEECAVKLHNEPLPEQEVKRPNPFAVLKQLKG